MYTHTFTCSKGKIDGTVNGKVRLPSGADVFNVDTWRASDLFRASDSPAAIGKVIADAVAASETIKIQREIRANARTQADADKVVAGYYATGSIKAIYVSAEIYATFTPEHLASLETAGTLVLPKDD